MSGDALPPQQPSRIEWEQQALDSLHTYLVRVENGAPPADLPATQRLIDATLQRMLSQNTRIVARNLVYGYRPHRGRYILLVEERHPGIRPFRWIAKLVVMEGTGRGKHPGELTDVEKARREQEARHREGILNEGHAWTNCVSHHDPVLLPARVVPTGCDNPDDALGVLYADGSQFIGVDRVIFLEEAFNDAVLFGNPTPASVLLALREVYDRLGIRLYSKCGARDPRVDGFTLEVPRLVTSLHVWDDPDNRSLADVRRDANSAVKQLGFRDPVERPVLHHSPRPPPPGRGTTAPPRPY